MLGRNSYLKKRILDGLRGCIGITVVDRDIAGRLVVQGASNDTKQYGWVGMPEEMRVEGRTVYHCTAEWSDRIFVFEDEVEVVDAPADMVVDAMIDMMYEVGLSEAAERMTDPTETIRYDEDDDNVEEA
jgi:hypothetical protein